jgi:hypothetical protein
MGSIAASTYLVTPLWLSFRIAHPLRAGGRPPRPRARREWGGRGAACAAVLMPRKHSWASSTRPSVARADFRLRGCGSTWPRALPRGVQDQAGWRVASQVVANQGALLPEHLHPSVFGNAWIGDLDLPDLNETVRDLTLQKRQPGVGRRQEHGRRSAAATVRPGRGNSALFQQTRARTAYRLGRFRPSPRPHSERPASAAPGRSARPPQAACVENSVVPELRIPVPERGLTVSARKGGCYVVLAIAVCISTAKTVAAPMVNIFTSRLRCSWRSAVQSAAAIRTSHQIQARVRIQFQVLR